MTSNGGSAINLSEAFLTKASGQDVQEAESTGLRFGPHGACVDELSFARHESWWRSFEQYNCSWHRCMTLLKNGRFRPRWVAKHRCCWTAMRLRGVQMSVIQMWVSLEIFKQNGRPSSSRAPYQTFLLFSMSDLATSTARILSRTILSGIQ